jgi:hypothetical protein
MIGLLPRLDTARQIADSCDGFLALTIAQHAGELFQHAIPRLRFNGVVNLTD